MNDEQFPWVGMQTIGIHASERANSTHAVSAPIWQTSTFRAESPEEFARMSVTPRPGQIYTRYGNPTHQQVEACLCELERGEAALVASSGMGAIFTGIMSNVRAGDHVVAQRNHYAGATSLMQDFLPGWGVECSFVDQTSIEAFEEAIRPNTKIIYAESPTNPLMRLTDLRALAELARGRGITTIIDNTFATPINQRPLDLGIDAVAHSATKYLGGHDDLTAGVLVGSRSFVERAWNLSIVAGAILSPFDAWLLLRGIRTLGLRVERHNRNALSVARFLETHPKVSRVHYPGLASHPQHALARRQMSGFTGVMSVELKGGYDSAVRFATSLKLVTYAASLGGVHSLIVHPAAMWGHELSPEQLRAAEVAEGLVRISIGLEDEEDLLSDFSQALDAA